MRVVIRSTDLPGSTCGERTSVQVGIQLGSDPAELVTGGSPSAEWVTEVQVTGDGDFRGPAVHGKRGERFLYLVWLADPDGERFGRVKVMLDEQVDRSAEVVTATVSLTDEHGRPRCARLRPPAISWS